MEDDICKLATRVGLVQPPARTPGPAPADGEVASFPFDGAHSTLVRAYEEAIATVPPPNDPILMPGQLHLVAPAPNHNMARNGATPSTGFGVSAERSGCQSDSYSPMGVNGAPAAGAQSFKLIAAEYSDNGWMAWF